MSFDRVKSGIYGGLAGGAVFGVLMGMMGMLAMIAGMVGSSSSTVGFAVHMMISAAIGASFAVLFGGVARSAGTAIAAGLGYGLAWWVIGPLTMMPLMMGMGLGVNWSVSAMTAAMPSLMGHLIYGGILGVVYGRLQAGARTVESRGPAFNQP